MGRRERKEGRKEGGDNDKSFFALKQSCSRRLPEKPAHDTRRQRPPRLPEKPAHDDTKRPFLGLSSAFSSLPSLSSMVSSRQRPPAAMAARLAFSSYLPAPQTTALPLFSLCANGRNWYIFSSLPSLSSLPSFPSRSLSPTAPSLLARVNCRRPRTRSPPRPAMRLQGGTSAQRMSQSWLQAVPVGPNRRRRTG